MKMEKNNPPIHSVCVYCGSSLGGNPAFAQAAQALGKSLAENDLKLVYGGGDKGLMGTVARAALGSGGLVTGIIPQFLMENEQPDQAKDLTNMEMIVVPDMHTRKQMMFEKADAFVALPGGIGTLEELVEMSTWAQLGRHSKPIILLNIDQFWSPYNELIDHMAKSGFLHNAASAMPIMLDHALDVIPRLLGRAS